MFNKEEKPSKAIVKNSSLKVRCKTDTNYLKKTFPHTWSMTSKEFHNDPDARLDFMMARVKDDVTINTFKNAIYYNRHLFIGRQVLVLNCGIDYLFTLFAAKTGALHIYGIDVSYAVEYLRCMVTANNLNDKITIIQGNVQDIKLPIEQVDVIISNWMGYSLLFDSKLEDVTYARDKWLKKGTGVIFPDRAQLYTAGIENSKNKNQHVDWWRDVNGFNMNVIRNMALTEPSFQSVNPCELLTEPVKVWSINLYKVTQEDLQFRIPFTIDMNRCGCLEGILTFFDVQFSKSHTPIQLTTSPWSPNTNWLQTVFYFDKHVSVNLGDKFYCGMEVRPITEIYKTKAYNVLMEVFTGDPISLSLVAKMNWSKKTQNTSSIKITEPIIILEQEKNIEKSYTDEKRIIATTHPPQATGLRTKSIKQKPAERKRRVTKKIAAALFIN